MKFSKASWIFLLIGVLVIAAASLGMTHSQQSDQQQRLATDLAASKEKLSQLKLDDLIFQKAALAKQYSDISNQFQASKAELISDSDSITSSNTLLDTARESSVVVEEITSAGTAAGKLAEVGCETLAINVKVQGTLSTISDFVSALTDKFPTATVSMVRASPIQKAGDDESAAAPAPTVTQTPAPSPSPSPAPAPGSSPAPTAMPKPGATHEADVSIVIYNYKGG
jgi:hypothetical protein